MKLIFAALIGSGMLASLAASAQETPKPQAAPMAADEPEHRGLGEVMALQQMRHLKLWFAGSAANWPLADYEVGELKEGFEDVTKLLGGDTVEKAIGGQMSGLEKAVESKNRAAFAKAFDQLSAGCNGCHQSLERGFIVITRPTLQPYSNQSFAPQKQ